MPGKYDQIVAFLSNYRDYADEELEIPGLHGVHRDIECALDIRQCAMDGVQTVIDSMIRASFAVSPLDIVSATGG